jgi:hypothetical protein
MMDKAAGSCYTADRSMILPRARALLAAAAVLAAGCNPPKYVPYRSVNKDFTTAVPWGWQIYTDQEGDGTGYAQTVFIGPFDPQFYLGAPSMTIRWYRSYSPHLMRDGRIESFAGPDDFIKRTLADIYGPAYELRTPVKDIDLRQSGLRAKLFVVLSRVKVPADTRNGVEVDEGGVTYNVRQHAYVLVPMDGGFYVLTYPATRAGYGKYDENFNQLVSAFLPVLRGPGGHKVRLPGPGKSGSAVDS